MDDGTVKCWVEASNGQLDDGHRVRKGLIPNRMGQNLPIVHISTNRIAKKIACGAVYTCELLDNNDVKCWGGNNNGELGLGDYEPRGSSPSSMGDNLPAIQLGNAVNVIKLRDGW